MSVYSQKSVTKVFYNEFGGGVSGNYIIGDWIEKRNFNNITQLNGIGISGIHRLKFKNKRVTIKNSLTLNYTKSVFYS